MAFLNSRVCPKCKKRIPLFLEPSERVRDDFLSAPSLKCPYCGQVSRWKVDFPQALLIWIFFLFLIASVVYLSLRFLSNQYPSLNLLVIIFSFLGGIFGFRKGFKLVEVTRRNAESYGTKGTFHIILRIAVLLLFFILFGFITGDWTHAAIGLVVLIIVHSAFYFSYWRRNSD